jgi:hypothetical protein
MTDPSGHEPYLFGTEGDPSTINTDLNGMLVFYGGTIVDPNDYAGAYAVSDPVTNTANILLTNDQMNAPPVTLTPYQEPIVIPSSAGDPFLGIPSDPGKTWYPSQMSQSDLNQLDRQITTVNMVSTLGSAWTLGLSAGLSAGPAIQTTGFTTAGPVSTVEACIAGCMSRAALRLNSGGLTAAQAAAVAKDPTAMARIVGSQYDALVKAEVESAISTGQLNGWRVTARFKFGPDLYNPSTMTWLDVTTPGQWAGHVSKYTPTYGTGSPLFYTRSNLFVTPATFP